MKSPQRSFQVSLRIVSNRLTNDQITALLDLQPIDNTKRKMNVWIYQFTTDASVPFQEQIFKLLNLLESKRRELACILASADTEAELFLGFADKDNQNAYLSPELLSRISKLQLAINLALDSPANSEQK